MYNLAIRDKHNTVVDEGTFEEGEILVGRSQAADVVLPSDNVSRRHARIYTVEGRCYVEDLNSSNGVFVNGRRIHEAHEIVGTAQLKVGDYYILIEGAAQDDGVFCRLHGQNLAFTEETFEIEERVTLIGRGKDCGMTVIDGSISRAHAKLTVDPNGSIILEDLNSSNGTFVNDEQIRVRTVEDGALLRFGNAEFILSMNAPVEKEHTTSPEWQAAPRRNRGPWIVLSIVVVLVAAGAVVFAIFADEIFGKSEDDGGKAAQTVCDVAPQGRCEDGETCLFPDGADAPACVASGSKKVGDECENTNDCNGGICVSMGALLGADVGDDQKVCHIFCKDSGNCGPADCVAIKDRPFKVCKIDRRTKKINSLLLQGKKQIEAKDWTNAKATYKKILSLDPVDTRDNKVQKRLNDIETAEEHKELLEKAQAGIKSGQPNGIQEAARNLWKIKDGAKVKQLSVYTPEARKLLRDLEKNRKGLLLLEAKQQSSKRCSGILAGLARYEAALAIDPSDAQVRKMRNKLQAKRVKKQCQPQGAP